MSILGFKISQPFRTPIADGYYHPVRYNALIRAFKNQLPQRFENATKLQDIVDEWRFSNDMGFLCEKPKTWEEFLNESPDLQKSLAGWRFTEYPFEETLLAYAFSGLVYLKALMKPNVIVRIKVKEGVEWWEDEENLACLVAGVDCFPVLSNRVRTENDEIRKKTDEFNEKQGNDPTAYHMLYEFNSTFEDLGYNRFFCVHHQMQMTESEFINQDENFVIPMGQHAPSCGPYDEIRHFNFAHLIPAHKLDSTELDRFKKMFLDTYYAECAKIQDREPDPKLIKRVTDF